jgi:hypothetical protein
MAYSGATTIHGPSRGSADAFFNWASDHGSARLPDVRLYLDTIYEFAPRVGMRAEVLVAQAVHEATDDGAPWNSFWWNERCNCIGNGITGDSVQDAASRDFENGRNVALCHLVHDWLYAAGQTLPSDLEPHRAQDPRWNAAIEAGHAGTAPTIDDFTGRYAMDPLYGEKWVARLNALEAAGLTGKPDIPDIPDIPDEEPDEETTMATNMTRHMFEGLDKAVWLPNDIEVIVDIVPASIKNVRSNQHFTGQVHSLYHETGNFNPGTGATHERNYLHRGADGAGKGFNFAVDDKQIIQLTPLDEVTWSAGRPWWNKHTWAVEQCVGKGLDLDRARRNAAALHAGLAVAKGWDVAVSMVQHNKVYGKNCPSVIRGKGTWASVLEQAKEFAARAKVASGIGGAIDDVVQAMFEPPSVINELQFDGVPPAMVEHDGSTFVYVEGIVQAIRETPRLQLGFDGASVIGHNIEAGEEFRVEWIFKSDDGRYYYYTPYATRVLVADTQRIEEDVEE